MVIVWEGFALLVRFWIDKTSQVGKEEVFPWSQRLNQVVCVLAIVSYVPSNTKDSLQSWTKPNRIVRSCDLPDKVRDAVSVFRWMRVGVKVERWIRTTPQCLYYYVRKLAWHLTPAQVMRSLRIEPTWYLSVNTSCIIRKADLSTFAGLGRLELTARESIMHH